MTKQNNIKPMSWLTIILILVVVSFAANLLFGIIGTVFDLPPTLTRGATAVGGVLAAFLIVRRKSLINRQNNR